jgi:hypothetical protein
VRRDDRQVLERPLPALHVVLLGRGELEQMPDRRRDDVLVALVVIVVLLEPAERPRDISGDGRLFGDDQFFGHALV